MIEILSSKTALSVIGFLILTPGAIAFKNPVFFKIIEKKLLEFVYHFYAVGFGVLLSYFFIMDSVESDISRQILVIAVLIISGSMLYSIYILAICGWIADSKIKSNNESKK